MAAPLMALAQANAPSPSAGAPSLGQAGQVGPSQTSWLWILAALAVLALVWRAMRARSPGDRR